MLNKLRERRDNESGFTLIELLVVILIIGILAAIALPAFLGQREKGQDSSAKSNARNAVSQVESCFTSENTYANCVTGGSNDVLTGSGITSSGTAAPTAKQVRVEGNGTTGYTITAKSDSNNEFIITKAGDVTSRSCTTRGKGACPQSGSW